MLTEKKDSCDQIGMRCSGWKKMKEVSLLESSSKPLLFIHLFSLIPAGCLLIGGHCHRLGAMISESSS